MRSLYRAVLFVAALVPATVRAQDGADVELTTQSGSRLWIDGKSSVKDWKCDATTVSATVTSAPFASSASLADVNRKVRRATLTVPVAKLDCRNATMNGHMRKALKADANQTISYRITKWDVAPTGSDAGTVTTSGTLTIAGKDLPLTVETTAARGAGGVWKLTGSKELRMTEWGIKPPTLMMGTMKVRDPVTIHFELMLASDSKSVAARP